LNWNPYRIENVAHPKRPATAFAGDFAAIFTPPDAACGRSSDIDPDYS
jgi:hypothetical protein